MSRKILLNSFVHRKKLVEIIKRKAKKHELDEEWALNNWWIPDNEKKSFMTMVIGNPDPISVANIFPHEVVEI